MFVEGVSDLLTGVTAEVSYDDYKQTFKPLYVLLSENTVGLGLLRGIKVHR